MKETRIQQTLLRIGRGMSVEEALKVSYGSENNQRLYAEEIEEIKKSLEKPKESKSKKEK